MYDKDKLAELQQQQEKWEETTLQRSQARFPERKERFLTTSSEPIRRLYTPLDVADLDYQADLGFPGDYPYTRGVHATMYRGRPWTMRMFAGFGTAEETNARFKYLLEQGNMGLSIAFDLPTLMGYDTDAPEALGEFGHCGVAVSSLQDMEILLDGIPLGEVSTSMTINSPAPSSGPCTSPPPKSRACPWTNCAARRRTTSSKSTSPKKSTSSRPNRRCGW
jgi:methylmalonyl-CoA mutase, N-terminal domain